MVSGPSDHVPESSEGDDIVDDLPPRVARLGGATVALVGKAPEAGDRLDANFRIAAARAAHEPLLASALREGFVVVSTLPNIGKRACTAQVVKLERLREVLPFARVVHVASDGVLPWKEVDVYHPDVASPGYALGAASPFDASAFKRAFGVGVEDSHRIAHGLFALQNGVFVLVDIPFDQFRTPSVERFIERARCLLQCFGSLVSPASPPPS